MKLQSIYACRLFRLTSIAVAVLAGFAAIAPQALVSPASAQGINWPWDQPPPKPREPVYKPQNPNAPGQWTPPPPAGGPAPIPPGAQPGGNAGAGAWSQKSNICLQLEQRLVQEGQKGDQSQTLIPGIEAEIRKTEAAVRQSQNTLDRANCYEYFLFTKTLRGTPQCRDMVRQVESNRRRLTELDIQRQQIQSSSGRSYTDDIVRELARNNCGANYQQQASRGGGGDGPIWQEESAGGGGLGNFNSALPYSTYRTLCVRQCDGYYFPISFSTLPNHFERDAELCQSKCAAPVDLYYHQNPGGNVEGMVGFRTNEPYASLRSAFRYRKEFVAGCSCKQAEYIPDASGQKAAATPQKDVARRDTGSATSGWSTEATPEPPPPQPQ